MWQVAQVSTTKMKGRLLIWHELLQHWLLLSVREFLGWQSVQIWVAWSYEQYVTFAG
jgi:hypothetical protein